MNDRADRARTGSASTNAGLSPNLGVPAVVAIGGSAGAIGVLLEMARDLPDRVEAAILVVVHRPPTSPSALPGLLRRASGRSCTHAGGNEAMQSNHIYVAPPDFHMRVTDSRLVLDRGPHENRNRPAIDPLFRSVAEAYGPRAVGVLLSGSLDDGSAGLAEIKRAGGTAVIQDPADAPYPDMPAAAARAVAVDYSVPGAQIATLIGHLVEEIATMRGDRAKPIPLADLPGESTDMSCPDCGGVLRIAGEPLLPRFVCRVGHAFSPETLAAAQDDQVERALWYALRALRERAAGARRLAGRFDASGDEDIANRYRQRAGESDEQADAIQVVLDSRADDEPQRESAEGRNVATL